VCGHGPGKKLSREKFPFYRQHPDLKIAIAISGLRCIVKRHVSQVIEQIVESASADGIERPAQAG
jgi:uncharacterized protein YlzI (FlbEa/FlbD family)